MDHRIYTQPLAGQASDIKARQQARQELTQAVTGAQEVLVKASTVFPFTLFPDTITLDREKLTVTHREFFMVGESVSMNINDLLNVSAQVGPFFGSVKIVSRYFDARRPYVVQKFWRKDALKIKQITQGYIIAMQKQIDCSTLTNRELVTLLMSLGGDNTGEQV